MKKKRVRGKNDGFIFNNQKLIAFVLVGILCFELVLLGFVDESSFTGKAIKSLQKVVSPSHQLENVAEECVPSEEICDGFDNDCDGVVDEGVCGAVDRQQFIYGDQRIELVGNNLEEFSNEYASFDKFSGEKILKENYAGYVIELREDSVIKYKIKNEK